MVTTESSSESLVSLSEDNPETAMGGFYATFERLAGQALPRDARIDSSTKFATLEVGEQLFATGSVDTRIHVILSGFLTLSYVSVEGVSWVKGFVPPCFPFACVSCLDGMPAPFTARAGTRVRVASVQFAVIDDAARQSIHWQRAVSNAFKFYGQRKEKREMELLMVSAEDRYLGFLREMPTIAGQLKQHEIASYVRVTPVSLSRIRRRLGLTPSGKPQ